MRRPVLNSYPSNARQFERLSYFTGISDAYLEASAETLPALAARALDPSSGRKKTGITIKAIHRAAKPKST